MTIFRGISVLVTTAAMIAAMRKTMALQ